MKTIAMYLPQFHRVPENDEWWGEGFTEWTTVKAAEKLYDTHNQLREPLNDNYYDLLKKDTMLWQAELARSYGIDGFCFYHYYFKDGRKILEKPAENLLQWKDIEMPFCFCWANETWARTWSNLTFANAWTEKFEKKDLGQNAILLEQNYGTISAWEDHLNYLLPFFEDNRYIKVNDRFVFLFYKPEDIICLPEMIAFWNKLLKQRGYQGIYAIGVNCPKAIGGLDAVLAQGPNAYKHPQVLGVSVEAEWKERVITYDYIKMYENALLAKGISDIKTYFGCFVDYDDTPRRGAFGNCTENVSPKTFEEYLYKMVIKNSVLNNEILFINAWNEWGEGNYLEPDKKNGLGFLEAVKRVKDKYINLLPDEISKEWDIILSIHNANLMDNNDNRIVKELNKYIKFYKLLDRWLLIKEKQKNLEEYFIDKKYKKIIIYGFSALGKHLYEELKDTSLEVVGVMDRRKGSCGLDLEIIGPEDPIPECDVIVMTPINDIEEVTKSLVQRTDNKLVSLEEVVYY